MSRPQDRSTGPTKETLTGTIERVTYHNAENGFAVLRVKARGHRDLITVVGHSPFISAGEFITVTGIWITDRTHGLQFKAEMLKATAPTTAEGIERYLASGQMRGIGPAMAKRIVAAFGEETFDIIEADEAHRDRRAPHPSEVRPRPGQGRTGALPDEPGRARRSQSERRTTARAQP